MHKKQHSYFYFLLPLLCLVLLGISSRSALADTLQTTDTPLPSSTPTYEPLFKTPTALPTLVSGCPSGTPIGWGTVTPGALWSAQCGPCLLTLTPQMTGTAYPLPSAFVGMTQTAIALTGTATSTATATATLGPTATPMPNYGAHISAVDSRCTLVNPLLAHCTRGGTTGAPYNDSFLITFHNDVDPMNWVSFDVYLQATNSNGWGQPWYMNAGATGGDHLGSPSSWGPFPLGSTGTGAMYGASINGWSGGDRGFNFGTWNGGSGFNWRNVDMYISVGAPPFPAATATPTATATPITPYCGTVNGSTPVDISDLPNVRIGPSTCASMGPYSISLSSLNWLPGLSGITDVSLPKVEICFREIYFGAVKVFGISFDLDILSAVITGVLALRWLFRS